MCGWARKRWKKNNSGYSGFQNTGYWSSGICFPFFSLFEIWAARCQWEAKELLGLWEQTLWWGPSVNRELLLSACCGCQKFRCSVWATSWSPDLMESVNSKGNFPRSLWAISDLETGRGKERNHCMPAFFFCSFLCSHLLILAGGRILYQIIWLQITWSNTSRLSHGW